MSSTLCFRHQASLCKVHYTHILHALYTQFGSQCKQVGAGVTDLRDGDHVLPVKSHAGTWRNLAVWKAKDLLKAGSPATIVVMQDNDTLWQVDVPSLLLSPYEAA
jgi:hypothetical protein